MHDTNVTAVYAEINNLNIILKGINTITCSKEMSTVTDVYGIKGQDTFYNISGPGSLRINIKPTKDGRDCYGILANHITLKRAKLDILVDSNAENRIVYGINSLSTRNKLSLEDGSDVHIKANGKSCDTVKGINTYGLSVSADSRIEVTADGSEGAQDSYAIDAPIDDDTCALGARVNTAASAEGATELEKIVVSDLSKYKYVSIPLKHTVHAWDDGVMTKEPTVTADGEMTYTCFVCGETKTEPLPPGEELLLAAKNAIAALDAVDVSAYSGAEKDAVQNAIAAAKAAINNAKTSAEVDAALKTAQEKISNQKTDAQKDEEAKKEQADKQADKDAKALSDAKVAALSELDKVDLSKYQEPEKSAVKKAVDDGKAAINAAATTDAVNAALESAKQAIAKQAVYSTKLPKVTNRKPAAAKKALKARWKKLSKKSRRKVSGIEIQIATDKKFSKNARLVKAGKTASSMKISKLKAKKTYYVRVRTYNGKSGSKTVGKWSKATKVRTK